MQWSGFVFSMKLSLVYWLMLQIGPASSKSVYDIAVIHSIAMDNFTYIEEVEDSWDAYNIYEPFEGDCEDFAFSMQLAAEGGEAYLVRSNSSEQVDHVVFFYYNLVWEMSGIYIYTLAAYNMLIGTILFDQELDSSWK